MINYEKKTEGVIFDYCLWKNMLNYNQRVELDNILSTDYETQEPKNFGASDSLGNLKKSSNVFVSKYSKVKHILKDIFEEAIKINNFKFGYDLFEINSMDSINYNIYESQTSSQYDWHLDSSQTIFYDVKLTLLINNSLDVYEGGNFFINSGNIYEIPDFSEPGSVLMIKSNLLHKVSPVTSGIRRSITSFLCGPRFR